MKLFYINDVIKTPNTIDFYSNERIKLHKLRLELIAHLRADKSLKLGEHMINEFLWEQGYTCPTPDGVLHTEYSAILFLAQFGNGWIINTIHQKNKYWMISLTNGVDIFKCRYIATKLPNPIVVSAITCRIKDISEWIDHKS